MRGSRAGRRPSIVRDAGRGGARRIDTGPRWDRPDVLRAAGATSNFLGYDLGSGPYPGVICASVNDRIVHGIPGGPVLADGDLSRSTAARSSDGWHGDAAITVPVGEAPAEAQAGSPRRCEAASRRGLAAATGRPACRHRRRPSRPACVLAPGGRYGIVEGYGGHGIGTAMHMDPHILNYGRPGQRALTRPGHGVRHRADDHAGQAQRRELERRTGRS